MELDPTLSNMKNYMIDCNTCNTENFGITTPPPAYFVCKGVLFDGYWIPQRGRVYT